MHIKEFGPLNDKKRERIHQGWWRTFVLNEIPGKHPLIKDENICNTIPGGTKKNFISEKIFNLISDILKQRKTNKIKSGKIDEDRLYNNLLSSQPLCVNFFGLLVTSENNLLSLFLSKILKKDIKESNIFFEYSGDTASMTDNSAYDVAVEYAYNDKKCLLGLECKYTDNFSYKPSSSKIYYGDIGNKNHDSYQIIYSNNQNNFLVDYYDFVRNKNYNQLFRNELIACCLKNEYRYDEVHTGLFCSEDDKKALKAGKEFESKIANEFHVITYKDYFENLQSLDITYETRKLNMLLWARYCGFTLSENIYNDEI